MSGSVDGALLRISSTLYAEAIPLAVLIALLTVSMAPGSAALKMTTDASDALAIAICHAHTAGTNARLNIRA